MDENRRLKELEEENKRLKKEVNELRRKCGELEKRLRIYESPHLPSSKHIVKIVKKVVRKPEKRGAPKGHKGATRKTPVPDRIVELKTERCPRCNSEKIRMKKKKKVVEDVQIIKVVTEYHFFECSCEKCGFGFVTVDENLPKKGNFGPNISTLWNMLHYYGTVPFDRLSKISKNCFGIDITMAGVHNAIYRTASIFEPYFNRIKNRVVKSKYVGSDETKYSFNGKCYWLWNFNTQKDTLVLLRESRGSKVLKEVFGDFLDAILGSDCFGAYGRFKAREYQKDWAHILRDAENLAKHNKEGEELHKMLSHMYKYIVKIKLSDVLWGLNRLSDNSSD